MLQYNFNVLTSIVWEKVKAAVEAQAGHYKKEIKALIEKYKPRILQQLKKVKKVIISEGKTLIIDMLGDTIKIIIKGGISDQPQRNGMKERMAESILSLSYLCIQLYNLCIHL